MSPAVQGTCCIFRFPCNCQPSVPCDYFVLSQSPTSSSFLETLTSLAFPSLCYSSLFFSFSYCSFLRTSANQKTSGFATEKLMQLTVLQEGCQCTQKQQHPVAVPGVCQLLNGASLKTGKVMALLLKMQANSWGWHGWGVSNADSSNQSLVGANHPACLALEQFGGAHFFWHSFGAPCLHWRAMQGHIKGHVFGPLPQTSWNQGNNINGPASSPRCVLVTSSGAVYLWVTTAPFLHHSPLAVSAFSSFLLSHFPFLVRWSSQWGRRW